MKNSKTKIGRLTQVAFRVVILISLTFIFHVKANAQIAVIAGGSYCNVRNDVFLQNKKPILAHNFGVSVQYYPFRKFDNLSVINEVIISQRGYQQDMDKDYVFRFNYLALPVLVNYAPLKQVSVNAGIELSKLLSTNIEQGNKTYNNFDLGLVLGLSCFNERRLSFYSRITHGLFPMLDYYTFDNLGNFTAEVHDLKNVCLSVGVKFKICNEKIYLHN